MSGKGAEPRSIRESEPPVKRRPVDVTTRWTTPTDIRIAAPSPTIARMNGGVPWIQAWWRHRGAPVIPNRWLSESRHVGLRVVHCRHGGRGTPPRLGAQGMG